MKSYEIYKIRRESLNWTISQLSALSGVNEREIEWYEEGKNIGNEKAERIKQTLRKGFCDLSSIDHYKARIRELAMEISQTDDPKFIMEYIGHMMVECGKLQMESVQGGPIRTKADWERIRGC